MSAWERMGFLTVTNTPIVDQNAVIRMSWTHVSKMGG